MYIHNSVLRAMPVFIFCNEMDNLLHPGISEIVVLLSKGKCANIGRGYSRFTFYIR